jgi:putative DNA primase/helicase
MDVESQFKRQQDDLVEQAVETAAAFLTALFAESDTVLFRPIETWNEGGKKRSRADYRNTCYHKAVPNVLKVTVRQLLRIAGQERLNIFFGVCPRAGQKGRFDLAWQIRTVRALWTDIDHVTVEDALIRVEKAGLPAPSIIVNSGNGVHLYWLLDAPYQIDDVDLRPVLLDWPEAADAKTGKKKPRPYIVDPSNNEKLYQDVPSNRPGLSAGAVLVQDVLAGIAEKIGGDHTTDLSRLLRLPATMNRKNERNGDKPVACELVSIDESRRYSFDAFQGLAANAPSRRRRDEIKQVKLPNPRAMSAAKRDKLHELALACSTAADRSRADWALVCKAIEKGWPQDEVWTAVANVGKFAERGEGYFLDTWSKAESHTQRRILDECRKKVGDATDSQGDNGDDESDQDGGGEAPSPAALAALICADDHFAQEKGGKVYHFAAGAYRPRGEQRIRSRVKAICASLGCEDEWSSRLANETVEYIRVDAPELWERPPEDVLNVKNGLLDVATLELKPHTPKWLSPVQIPVIFDPAATCPKIDKFCGETFPEDNLTLAYEIVAWLMLPDGAIQKAVLLIGAGGNGKSRYLRMALSFLGKSNVSSLSLHRLEADRFACGRLVGKLANICPDLPSEHLAGTSVFKAITGGDELTGEHKFLDSFDFTPFCRLLFSANHPPRAADASEGFFDRWLVVPFDRRFRGEQREITSTVLDAMLSEPGEQSGLLNRALEALPGLRKRGRFSESDSTRAAFDEFHATTDPIAVWLDAHTVDEASAVTPQSALLAVYSRHCELKGIAPTTKNAFGRALHKLRPNVTDKQRTVGGKPNQWCYVGIGLRSEHSDAADLTDFPNPNIAQRKQRDQLDSSLLVYADAREKITPENTSEDWKQEEAIRVDRVVSVECSNAEPCDHEPQERTTFDGFVRTECGKCGVVLKADRSAKAVMT